MTTKLLSSPLAATALVLTGMGLLALPLRHLTAQRPPAKLAAAPQPTNRIPSALTLKLLTPIESATLATPDGTILWSLSATDAGDQECRTALPIVDDTLELVLRIQFAPNTPETAAFLTVEPDQHESITRHAIGRDRIEDVLTFHWTNR